MTKQIMAIISLALFLLLASLAVRGWRKRSASQSSEFSAPLEALEYFGELLEQAKAFYVATTRDSNHLDRITAYGLGARGFCQVFIFTEGVLIVRKGERSLAIDSSKITAVELTQVAIDKAVESNGLTSIAWLHDGVKLATQLRIVDDVDRGKIVKTLTEKIIGDAKREVNK